MTSRSVELDKKSEEITDEIASTLGESTVGPRNYSRARSYVESALRYDDDAPADPSMGVERIISHLARDPDAVDEETRAAVRDLVEEAIEYDPGFDDEEVEQ